MRTHPLRQLTIGLLILASAALSGCTLPMKGTLRTDVDAAPPTGDSVIAIKPTDAYDRKAVDRDELKPLLEAVAKMDRPVPGCWARKMESTFYPTQGETAKDIILINPSKPPAEMIELILVKNHPPTEEQKKASAEQMLKSYDRDHKNQVAGAVNTPKSKRKQRTMLERLQSQIKNGSCHMETNDNILKYTILTGKRTNYKFGYGEKCEYLVDLATNNLVAYNKINLVGMKIYGAVTMNMEVFEEYKNYALVPGCERPLLSSSKTVMKLTGHILGVGGNMDGTTTKVFTDYKKVTCYDDRFTVTFGEETVVDDDRSE